MRGIYIGQTFTDGLGSTIIAKGDKFKIVTEYKFEYSVIMDKTRDMLAVSNLKHKGYHWKLLKRDVKLIEKRLDIE